MLTAPSPTSVALLLGLSFFLGLAFEDFFAHATQQRPGGIRTFPMLALAGGMLYLLEPAQGIAFTAGLLVLGAWLVMYYRTHLAEPDETGEAKANLIVPLLNVHAYLLGAVALALPPWVAVTTTVAAVLLLTGRTWLHDLARRIDMKEIVIAGQFLILTGIILPLLPATSCQKQERAAQTSQPTPTAATGPPGYPPPVMNRPYQATGVVVLINRKEGWIEINHDEIKGLMPAMQMEFWVKDKSLFDNARTGDRVDFTIVETEKGEYLTELKRATNR